MQAEQEEKKRKDRRKRLKEQRHTDAEAGLYCNHPGCSFVAVNKAGLTNHRRQRHTLSQVAMCAFCAPSLGQQELHNHQRFCSIHGASHSAGECVCLLGEWLCLHPPQIPLAQEVVDTSCNLCWSCFIGSGLPKILSINALMGSCTVSHVS